MNVANICQFDVPGKQLFSTQDTGEMESIEVPKALRKLGFKVTFEVPLFDDAPNVISFGKEGENNTSRGSEISPETYVKLNGMVS